MVTKIGKAFPLAIVAGAAAVLALVMGQVYGLPDAYGIAATGFVLAIAVARSRGMSSFLRIFVTIFTLEYAVFTLVRLFAATGLWPAALSGLVPPSSLPVTVGIFGTLVVLISYIPVVRLIMCIAYR